MKRYILIMLVLLLSLLFIGCSTIPPFIGAVGTDSKYPANAKMIISDDGTIGSREGRASSHFILGLVAFGDSSVKGAAYKGGITKIKTVEHKYSNFCGILYGEYTTIVTGD